MEEVEQKTLLLGMPCGSGMVPAATLSSMLLLKKPIPAQVMIVERQRTDKARNAMAIAALDGGFDYLLMVDDDNPVPDDTLEKLISANKDIVIAPILCRVPDPNGNYAVNAYYAEEQDFQGTKIKLYKHVQNFRDEGPLHRIDAGGTGCMLIKRYVLEKLVPEYEGQPFAYTKIPIPGGMVVNGKTYKYRDMSEDMEFCERAVNAGFEIWLDERVRPGHLIGQRALKWMP